MFGLVMVLEFEVEFGSGFVVSFDGAEVGDGHGF